MATEKAPIVGSSASTSLPTLSVQDGTLPLTPGAQGMQTGTIDGHRQLQSPVSRSSSAGEDKMREKARDAQEQVGTHDNVHH